MVNMERILVEQENGSERELQLWQHQIEGKREWELLVNGVFIMATYNRLSSEVLVSGGLAKISGPAPWAVLIGGLGMGFSVREACLDPRVSFVEAVEVEATVVAWNRSHLAAVNDNCLADGRVQVRVADFFAHMMETEARYDLIAMDIDNGPMMLAREGNRRVYDGNFFRRAQTVLRPGGVFAVWSCNPAPELLRQGREIFSSAVEETVFEAHGGRMVPYYIYFMADSPR